MGLNAFLGCLPGEQRGFTLTTNTHMLGGAFTADSNSQYERKKLLEITSLVFILEASFVFITKS